MKILVSIKNLFFILGPRASGLGKISAFSLPVLAFGFVIFGPLMAMGPRLMPGAIVYAALALSPLLLRNWRKLPGFTLRPVIGFAALTIAYTCLSSLWSPSPHAHAFAIDVVYLSLCTLLITAELSFVPEEAKNVYLLFFALSLLAGFFVLAEEFIFDHPIHRWFNHLSADAPLSENVVKRTVALFSMIIWPTALWLERVRGRVWAIAAVFGFLWFSLITTNRSAALGMMVGALVLVIGYFAPKILRWGLTLSVAAGLTLAVPLSQLLLKLPPKIAGLLFSSAQQRVKIWYYTGRHILEKPLFGHGLDSSSHTLTTVGPEGLPLPPGTYVISAHPHNIFLQLWMDFGVVGVVLWGALIFFLILMISRLAPHVQAYAWGAFSCSLAMLCTTFTPFQAWWAGAHIATAMMFMLTAQSFSNSKGMSGKSAGGMG